LQDFQDDVSALIFLKRIVAVPTLLLLMMAFQALWVAGVWLIGGIGSSLAVGLVVINLVLGAAALWLPARTVLAIDLTRVSTDARKWWLLGALFSAAVGYGIYQGPQPDEPALLASSRLMASQGIGPFLHEYTSFGKVGELHPPLMPLTLGMAMRAVGDSPAWLHLIPAALLMLTVAGTYLIGAELFDRTTGMLAAALFLAPPYTFRYGTALLNDIGVLTCFTFAVLLAIR